MKRNECLLLSHLIFHFSIMFHFIVDEMNDDQPHLGKFLPKCANLDSGKSASVFIKGQNTAC